jgi:hypothetical protein
MILVGCAVANILPVEKQLYNIPRAFPKASDEPAFKKR